MPYHVWRFLRNLARIKGCKQIGSRRDWLRNAVAHSLGHRNCIHCDYVAAYFACHVDYINGALGSL